MDLPLQQLSLLAALVGRTCPVWLAAAQGGGGWSGGLPLSPRSPEPLSTATREPPTPGEGPPARPIPHPT